MQYKVGDAVTMLTDLYENADDYSPGGYLAMKGDKLIVRAVRPFGIWPISISHEERTDGVTFAVAADEIDYWGKE